MPLLLSRPLLYEAVSVLLRPKLRHRYGYTPQQVERFARLLLLVAHPLVHEIAPLHAVPGDPKDDMVIVTAVAASADYLVTGLSTASA